jgi:hypothetical protein
MVYLDDVAYWTRTWQETGEVVSDSVARSIADYWQIRADPDDIAAAIAYARSAGVFEATLHELYALKAWVLCKV